MKYLSKKEKMMYVLMSIINLAAIILVVLSNSLLLRIVSAIIFIASSIPSILLTLKIQAHITRDELSYQYTDRYGNECSAEDYDEDEEDDDEEEDDNEE